jgi:opacity protein-like surface antigen
LKILFTAAAVAALSFAGSAFAGADWRADDYAQINIGSGVAGSTRASASGIGSATADLNAGFLGGGLVGHAFGDGLSVEVEGLYDQNNVKGADARVESFGGLANLKFEAPLHYKVMQATLSPYVAGGVGYGQTKYDIDGLSANKDGVMWQAKVGLAIHATSKLTWDLGYRYLQLPQLNFGGGNKIDTYVHGITVGLRWNF